MKHIKEFNLNEGKENLNKPKRMDDIDPNIVLSVKNPPFNSYDNKKLNEWDADDFVEYIKMKSNIDLTHMDTYFDICCKDYFEDLPKLSNPRVYLYGVWVLIKEYIKK
jgi:hypothetical protein